jgi:molybdopterin converting factor subunit 1
MRVTLRLFARLRDIVGAAELTRDVADGATIGDVWRGLTREYPALADYERSISSAVNADYARMDQTLKADDEVAFLPPVSGGELVNGSVGDVVNPDSPNLQFTHSPIG